jgi:hypothetical protein
MRTSRDSRRCRTSESCGRAGSRPAKCVTIWQPCVVDQPSESPRNDQLVSDLWRFYDEHAAEARQHETLRATVTSILVGFAAALVGFASTGGLEPSDIPAGVLVIVIGVLGGLLSLKHYERNRLHTRILGAIRLEITELRKDPKRAFRSTGEIRDAAEKKHNEKFRLDRKKGGSWLVRTRLFQLWIALDLLVAVVGAVIVVVSAT